MHTADDVHTALFPRSHSYTLDDRPSCMFSHRMQPAIFWHKLRINSSKIIHLLVRARTGGQMLIADTNSLTRLSLADCDGHIRADIFCLRAFFV